MNFADRVKDSTLTTGTGTLTLVNSAPAKFRTFAAAYAVGATGIPYSVDDSTGWEDGYGTLVTSTTLSRDTVLSSSNSGSLVNFGAGTKTVFVTAHAVTLGVALPFVTTWSLLGQTTYAPTNVSGAMTITVNNTGAVEGAFTQGAFVANGSNVPAIVGAVEDGSSAGYVNTGDGTTQGVLNRLRVWREAATSFYAWMQDAALAQVPRIGLTPSAGTLQFSATNYPIGEAGGTVTVTVTRTGGSAGAASVAYATSNGTATSGSDYTAASGTLNWTDGDAASKTFAVTIADDVSAESSETINLTLSSVTGAALGTPSTATITIADNDTITTQVIRESFLTVGGGADVTESGSSGAGWIYTGSAGSSFGSSIAATPSLTLASAADGEFCFAIGTVHVASACPMLIMSPLADGMFNGSGAYAMDCGGTGGAYRTFKSGTLRSTGAVSADNDQVRVKRAGTTVTWEKSSDVGATWSVIDTATGEATPKLYPTAAFLGAASANNLRGTGLS